MFRVVLLYFLFLSSCVSKGVWYKADSTEADYHKVRYECLKESQQLESQILQYNNFDPFPRPYYNFSSGMRTNNTLFNACMNANGFYWKAIKPE
jgi:hypothetical protein